MENTLPSNVRILFSESEVSGYCRVTDHHCIIGAILVAESSLRHAVHSNGFYDTLHEIKVILSRQGHVYVHVDIDGVNDILNSTYERDIAAKYYQAIISDENNMSMRECSKVLTNRKD